jgi:hypothetical protein
VWCTKHNEVLNVTRWNAESDGISQRKREFCPTKTPAEKHQIDANQTLNSITYEGPTPKCTSFEMEKTQLKQIHKLPFDTVQLIGISRPNVTPNRGMDQHSDPTEA